LGSWSAAFGVITLSPNPNPHFALANAGASLRCLSDVLQLRDELQACIAAEKAAFSGPWHLVHFSANRDARAAFERAWRATREAWLPLAPLTPAAAAHAVEVAMAVVVTAAAIAPVTAAAMAAVVATAVAAAITATVPAVVSVPRVPAVGKIAAMAVLLTVVAMPSEPAAHAAGAAAAARTDPSSRKAVRDSVQTRQNLGMLPYYPP